MPYTITFLTANWLPFGKDRVQFSHRRGGPDFSRIEKGQVHMLADHEATLANTLGKVDSASHDSQASKAQVHLYDVPGDPMIAKARVLMDDEEHRGISAGLTRISDARDVGQNDQGGRDYIIDNWQVGEMSLVPMPRDADTDVAHDMEPYIINADGSRSRLSVALSATQPIPLKEDPSMGDENSAITADEMRELMAEQTQAIADGFSQAVQTGIAAIMQAQQPAADPTPVQNDSPGGGAATAVLEPSPANAAPAQPDPPRQNSDDRERISEMARLAGEQACYDGDQVRQLQMEAVANLWTPSEYMDKLKTIQVQPAPIAPLDSGEQKWDLGRALLSVATGNFNLASYERTVSEEIMRKSNVTLPHPNRLAIPRGELAQLNTTTASGSGGPAIEEMREVFIRSDLPDPLDIVDMCYQIPSGPGDSYVVPVDVPATAMVAEPGDNGYAKTGDATATAVEIAPKIANNRQLITRLARVQTERLFQAILAITLQKTREIKNGQIVAGTGANDQATGVYNTANVGTVTITAAPTVAQIRAALANGFELDDMNKAIIVSKTVDQSMRNYASPTAVARFYESNETGMGMVDMKFPVHPTKHLSVGGTKNFRGVVTPLGDIYFKHWDDAVFVDIDYRDGNYFLIVEEFFNFVLGHASAHYRFHEA